MNSKMVLGQYYNTDSFIHRLDARTKMIGLILGMVIVFLIPRNDFIVLAVVALILLITVFLTNVPIIRFLKSLKQIAFLLVFSFMFQVLFNKDELKPVLDMNLQFSWINIAIVIVILCVFFCVRKYLPLKFVLFLMVVVGCVFILQYPIYGDVIWNPSLVFYQSGLITGAFIIARVFLIITLSTILTLTTKPTDLTNALEWLLKPFEYIGLKTSILAMMISIALRFIPTLFNETDKILKAQASRGVDFKEGKLREQIMQIISLLIPMFVISFKRASDLADAMEARGYIPGAKRTRLTKMQLHWSDYVTLIILIGSLAGMIVWRVV